jgi:hypothetical protein
MLQDYWVAAQPAAFQVVLKFIDLVCQSVKSFYNDICQ